MAPRYVARSLARQPDRVEISYYSKQLVRLPSNP